MAAPADERPSLWRPSLFALTWQVCTWLGWGLVVLSVARLNSAAVTAMGLPLLMIAAVIALSELRPIVMTRLVGNPVSISLAFVFAALYLWGLYPALVLHAGATVLSELLERKAVWKLLFNVGQYVTSLAAAWLVLAAAGVTSSPFTPLSDLSGLDLGWLVGSWMVYHVVNLGLVAGLAGMDGQTWWESFSEEFWFYTVSVLAVLALSPLIAIVAIAYPLSWTLLPLLLLPLLAVQKAAEMSRQKEHEALHDALTGLPNRLLVTDRIEQALARATRSAGRVVVIFLDLDLFKVVNDSLGHAAGDALLIEVASRLQAVVRPGDTLARFGGDEFVIVCDDVAAAEVGPLADRVIDALRDPFTFEGRQATVTASLGVALASPESDAEILMRDADAAMYRAKAAGRDQVMVFDETMHRQAAARLNDEVGLRRALRRDEFRTFFQPIIDLDTGGTIGMEALVRWQDPDRGLIGPDLFIPVAEETGLIVAIGSWVLDDALTHTQRWRQEIPEAQHLRVAINISARELASPGLVDRVARSISAAGIPATAVQLEITESAVMNRPKRVIEALNSLRSLGVGLAVDDFGTGYSSLAYLKQLPVDTVKIDRSFIDGLGGPDDASDRPIVDAIINIAESLHLQVIAEGVENAAQLEALRQLGGDVAQGFLWSAPLPAEHVPGWLADHHGVEHHL